MSDEHPHNDKIGHAMKTKSERRQETSKYKTNMLHVDFSYHILKVLRVLCLNLFKRDYRESWFPGKGTKL